MGAKSGPAMFHSLSGQTATLLSAPLPERFGLL